VETSEASHLPSYFLHLSTFSSGRSLDASEASFMGNLLILEHSLAYLFVAFSWDFNERKLMEARRSERSEESLQFLYVSRGERSLWNVRTNVWRQAKLQLIFRLFLFEAFLTSSDH
jgi:hypothetical protein